jgi:hypothetical protein
MLDPDDGGRRLAWWQSEQVWFGGWIIWGLVYPAAMIILGVVYAAPPGVYFRSHWAANVTDWLVVSSLTHALIGPFVLGRYRWASLGISALMIPLACGCAIIAGMQIDGQYL